jgi:FkbM family methyltransferase
MIGSGVIRSILRRMGRDIVAFDPASHPIARRMHFLRTHQVTVVLDVGANAGQYARSLRSQGYRGRIISFEPQSAAYRKLSDATAGDELWTAQNNAAGSYDGTAVMNIAANSSSSSLLEMLPSHLRSAPGSSYTGRETVSVRKLDSLISELGLKGDTLYLKSDTQGYEADVLAGAEQSLESIVGIEMELSLTPLYEGETLLPEMIQKLDEHGFVLMSLDPAFSDPATGRLLQVDATFFRNDGANRD